LHVNQAISVERPARLLTVVFGLVISEGAIANTLACAGTPLTAAACPIADAVGQSTIVESDEILARFVDKTWWQWVLLSSAALCHIIADSRAIFVVTAFPDGLRPSIGVADCYGGQLGHG
jgi:hypothetical protein